MSTLYVGDMIRLRFDLKPLDNVVALRSEISLQIKLPDDTIVDVDNADIEESASNKFYYDYLITQPLKHSYKFTSSGTVYAVDQGTFAVKENLF